ncbi:venom carboxylesterase-6-like isoform X2 [Sitophilus oryzae]|uniref:Carboxylic ester hydrolase n=1 Tax=Sitophilus oryzae TaxID=7048 RepID=A0A6J2XD54_SITOR|nr:venom carboxylesterase-6-like isoform X2 [Sitophilus oryzae]
MISLAVSFIFLQLVSGLLIQLPDGRVEGTTDTTRAGTTYHSFLAMRYAEPPIGQLRFQPAQAVSPWNDTYDATSEKNICYQVNEDSIKESEDCLFVNVFSPKNLTSTPIESDLTVMVWIHGGGFIQGAGYMNEGGVGPKFFMDEDVVLVAFNYRLGPFGFLSTGDKRIPGNLGLKDQVFALKWVQQNIKYFGGDPNKVTIFGQSAGSSSVSYQLLSSQSEGLYRAAILESGTALSPWAYQRYERDISFLTAKYIDPDFNGTTSDDLLDFLNTASADSIDKASAELNSHYENASNYQISKGFFYAPVIEVSHNDAFLTKPQYGLFENGTFNKVPIIMGMNAEESLALLSGDPSYLWKIYDSQPEVLVPFDMHIENEELKKSIGSKIKDFFAAEGFENSLANSIKYHSVHDFDKAGIKQAQLISAYTSVYFYNFVYSGVMGNNINNKLNGTGNVTHSEELNYIFSKWYSNEIPDNTDLSYFPKSDKVVHDNLMALWTNFAKNLVPTTNVNKSEAFQWDPVDPEEFKYLEIGEQLLMKKGYPKSEKYIFWDQLYTDYAVPPFDTF